MASSTIQNNPHDWTGVRHKDICGLLKKQYWAHVGGGFRPQPIDKCHHNAMRSENIMSFVYDLAVTGRDSRRRRIHDYKFFAVTTDLFL